MSDENNEDLKKEILPIDPQGGDKDLKQETPTDPEGEKESESFYKKELEKVKGERDNYKEGLLSKKEQIKKMKEENPEVNKEEIESIVSERVGEETKKFREEFNRERFETELSALTEDPDKLELIRHHYQNSINPTGSIRQDLRRALLLADEKKIFSENEELRKSLSAQNSISNSSQGASVKRDVPENYDNVKLDSASQDLLNRMNANRKARGMKELTPQDIIKQ